MFFKKKKLSENEFSEKFAKKLVESVKGLEIVSINELEIKTNHGDSGEFTHFLDNCYSEYCNDSKNINIIFNKYLNTAKSLYLPKESIKLDMILPVIKDSRFVSNLKKLNPEFEQNHVYEQYNSELFIFFAEDKEYSVNYLTQEDLELIEISQENLKSKSIDNLKNIISVQRHGENGYFMVIADGNYESSLILLDIWNQDNFKVQGKIIIGIPARDVLLVTGKDDNKNIEKMNRTIVEINETGDHIVSNKLFEFVNGKFEVL